MVSRKHIVILFLILSSIIVKASDADTALIKQHLITITKTEKFRNHKNIEQLNVIADYIKKSFQTYTDSVSFQEFDVNGKTYKNVIASFGTEHKKRIVIGSHYDVCGNQEGADDNASGIVGLLELARMLKNKQLNYRIDLVAYTLEEPPHFKTEFMGSYIHAKYLNDNKINIYGMLSVEMIGYFSDEKKSQTYPVGLLSLFYGNKGNYITLVRKFGSGKFARKFVKRYKKSKTIITKKFTGPKFLPGIDFSDHLNYWKFGFSALMITDTSFYRNFNYHEQTDTIETLDINKMAKVIDGIYNTITTL